MKEELDRVRCDCKSQLRFVSEYLRLAMVSLNLMSGKNVKVVDMCIGKARNHTERALELLERGKAQ